MAVGTGSAELQTARATGQGESERAQGGESTRHRLDEGGSTKGCLSFCSSAPFLVGGVLGFLL